MKYALLLLFFGCSCYSQDSIKTRLTHLSFEIGSEQLWHGSQTADELSNIVHDQSVMVHLDSSLNLRYTANRYQFISYGINVGFKKAQSKLRFVTGVSVDSRGDRYYSYRKENRYRIDTVYQEYQNSGQVDTLYLDSLSNHNLIYSLRSSTFFGRFEGLVDFNKGLLKFSTGIGLMAGVSVSEDLVTTYNRHYLYETSDSNNQVVYQSPSMPIYNESLSFSTAGSFGVRRTSTVNGRVVLKPYVPIYLEVGFGKNNFWNHLALSYKARVGAEFQIIKNEGINPRFFYSQHVAFVYKI